LPREVWLPPGPTGRSHEYHNYRATLVSHDSCLKLLNTFRDYIGRRHYSVFVCLATESCFLAMSDTRYRFGRKFSAVNAVGDPDAVEGVAGQV